MRGQRDQRSSAGRRRAGAGERIARERCRAGVIVRVVLRDAEGRCGRLAGAAGDGRPARHVQVGDEGAYLARGVLVSALGELLALLAPKASVSRFQTGEKEARLCGCDEREEQS